MAKGKQQEQAAQEAPAEERRAEEQQAERLTHWQAAHRVVKQLDGDTTLTELAGKTDALVVAGGAKSNPDRASDAVYGVLQSLAELGVVELEEEVRVHPLGRLAPAGGQAQ